MDQTTLIIVIVAIAVGIATQIYLRWRKNKRVSHITETNSVQQPEEPAEPEIPVQTITVGTISGDGTNLEVQNISKSFNSHKVVNDVSFSLSRGEIFGMVGPNGAGKTTTIRMILDILKPDSGDVTILGQKFNDAIKEKIGYLPEERGLYKKLTVMESLTYMAALKGIESIQARARAIDLLEKVDMSQHKDKKVEELSRGMSQIIQFLITIQHDPEIMVLDEPFANLDPVNTKLLKDMVLEMRNQGKSIILSTHLMNEVEEMCDRILMINKGRAMLYGNLIDIKAKYRNNSVFVECDRLPEQITGVSKIKKSNGYTELFLEQDTAPQAVLNVLVSDGVKVDRFENAIPSLNDIFIQVVEETR
jgi:ABC-2 type transport system ATP-binding protein